MLSLLVHSPGMSRTSESTLTHPLKRICERLEIRLEELRGAIEKRSNLNVSVSTIQYYWDDKKFKGGPISSRKPWLKAMREHLMARGMTPEEASELFGAYYNRSEIADLSSRFERMERKIDAICDALMRNGMQVKIDEPSKLTQPLPDYD